MLDESMFEDIHEIAENSAYLKAVEEKDVSLEMLEQLPAYDELKELEEGLRQQKMLTFQNIFNEPTGYYMIKCFLIADYAVDKAIFIKDVEAYKSMRFESARRKIAKLLYQRFVSPDSENDHKQFPKGSSVFQLIRQERAADAADEKSMAHGIDSKAGMQTGAAGGIASVGTPTGQAMGQNIQVPGAANTNNSTSAMAAASPAATGGNGVGVLTPSGPNSLPLNASGPGAAAAAAMLNPSPGGGVGGGAVLVGSPPHGNGGVAMTKLGPGGAAAANGSLSSDAKGPNHKPSGSADKLAVGPGPDKAQAQDQHLTAAGAASPTQPGRSSHTAITMNITSAAGTSAAPGDHSIVTKADPSSKEPEKTVISSTGHVTTQTLHSHNGPHSATHGTMKVVGGGLGSASSATTGAGGERVEFQIGNTNNAIGVYGKMVKKVRERVQKGEAPKDLFDEVAQQVMNDLKLDVFPRFKQSDFYKKYIRTKSIETMKVSIKDFTTFRVLGRGGFGAVHACRKTNSGTLYAMKCINKKLVKVKSALDNVLEERNVLTMMKSNFVTNLKYALQDDETLYLIMDLMLGGDLKFHLINAGRFTEKRARFYAAEVLLGLEHVHNASIIYRDMKLENVLLDHLGHCRISDLGLAVVTKTKIKGYAGTPGYTAPEMIKNKLYGPSADIFSFGVMLYRMLCGSKPFKGKIDRDLDKAVVDRKPQFPKEIFSKDAILLLTGLLHKRPENRLGCNEKGIEEIKDHPFFESIDWGLLEAGYLDPPFVPNKFDVNAASLKDIGDFDKTKYKNVKLDERFKQRVKNFHFVSIRALQDEMVSVLEKADENVNFEKFAPTHPELKAAQATPVAKCCVML